MTFVLFCLWMFILFGRPQDVFLFLAPTRPAVVLGILTWASAFFISPRTLFDSFLKIPEARKILLFYGVMLAGVPFAYHRRVAFEFVLPWGVMNLFFFIPFVQLVNSVERLRKIVGLIIYVSLFYSVFGLMKGSFNDGRFFIYGMMFDPNDIAYVLVSLLPFSLSCFVLGGGWFIKIVSITAAASSVILVLYTGSRGGFLGLVAVGVLLFFTNMGSVKAIYKLSLLVGLLVVAIFIHGDINVERYISMVDVGSDYNVNAETGRLGIWTRAYDLLLENPIMGVGAGCFSMAVGYLRESAGAQPVWQEAHNSYVQVVVEIGLIGGAAFLWLIVGSLQSFSRSRNIEMDDRPSSSRNELRAMAGLMQVAFVAHLICAFFLSQGYSLIFTMFFGLSAIMRRLTDDSACMPK